MKILKKYSVLALLALMPLIHHPSRAAVEWNQETSSIKNDLIDNIHGLIELEINNDRGYWDPAQVVYNYGLKERDYKKNIKKNIKLLCYFAPKAYYDSVVADIAGIIKQYEEKARQSAIETLPVISVVNHRIKTMIDKVNHHAVSYCPVNS